ncbi:hypothetical protein AsGV025 [Agrotis segetum granulovirus]|uniref:Uncharacterized protein n=1 Tax=Agrotis segetum granulosis virus TaxID=10464 RepID=A0A023MIJ4_GVAS|nr:hypothetical protein AsGV025 [Agrotis segetum granulovirus]AHN92064.1 hypothetical protein AsGV025 [Agrotis segetum granulovirus]AKN63299.1 hypothetical protein AsGV025 [Agrotis segetum granulovirus]
MKIKAPNLWPVNSADFVYKKGRIMHNLRNRRTLQKLISFFLSKKGQVNPLAYLWRLI